MIEETHRLSNEKNGFKQNWIIFIQYFIQIRYSV